VRRLPQELLQARLEAVAVVDAVLGQDRADDPWPRVAQDWRDGIGELLEFLVEDDVADLAA
jgi:hypothetical protein